MTLALVVALAAGGGLAVVGLIVAFVVRTLRRTDPDRAVAAVAVTPGAPFSLRFTTNAPGPHRVWLRFEIDYVGGRYDYGITAETQAQTGAGPTTAAEIRLGYAAPVLSPSGVQRLTLYRMSRFRTFDRSSLSATAEIASLPAAPPGSAAQITGRIVLSERCTPRSLLVFVLPA